MAQNETWLNHDMIEAVRVQYLDGNLFSMDNAGNLIGVNLTRDGVDYSGGGSVSASVIRADGSTVSVVGALSGNVATVVLPQAAYAVPGLASIVVKLTVSGEVTTIAAVVANVYQSSTDSVVDPGTIIPSVQALISAIESAVASIPADYSALWASLAPAFSTSTNYTAGQYVTYNGGLYRFTVDHAAGAWNSAHVTATNIGSDLNGLKSALENYYVGCRGDLSDSNLNNILTPGVYRHANSDPAATNVPEGMGSLTFILVVMKAKAQNYSTLQILINGWNGNDNVYYRTYTNTDGFGSWSKIATGSDLSRTVSLKGYVTGFSTNLNSIVENGLYWHSNSDTAVTNAPTSAIGASYFNLFVFTSNNNYTATQLLITWGSNTPEMYYRTFKDTSNFSDWQKIATQADIDSIQSILNKVVVTSKNLLPVETKSATVNNVACTYSDGEFTLLGTANGGGGRTTKCTDTFVLKAGTYTASTDIVHAEFYLQNVSGNAIIATINTLNAVTFTLNADTTVYLGFSTLNGRSYTGKEHIQIEKGSTATAITAPSYAATIDIEARNMSLKPNVIKPFIQTTNDSGFKIYCRTNNGFICYTLLHQIVSAINCNSWRIELVSIVNEDMDNAVSLTTSGEMEMAIMLTGRSDYIGGRAHGDEVTASVKFFIDGIPYDPANIQSSKEFNELVIISTSDMYDPNDSITKVGVHGKKYTFTKDRLKLEQYIDWVASVPIDQLYLSMLTASKAVTDYGYTNQTYVPFELEESYGYYNGIDFIAEYSDDYCLSMEAEKYPCPTGQNKPTLRLTDNNNDYNKAYFVGYSGNVSAGDRMDSVTYFTFKGNVN